MKREDIDNIISVICPNDEDYEKPIISPAYLKNELEALALEQEPILDKIIAEIQGLRNCSCSCSDGIIDDVEDIIDKYKAESEDKE
jgi:hypothetical protein